MCPTAQQWDVPHYHSDYPRAGCGAGAIHPRPYPAASGLPSTDLLTEAEHANKNDERHTDRGTRLNTVAAGGHPMFGWASFRRREACLRRRASTVPPTMPHRRPASVAFGVESSSGRQCAVVPKPRKAAPRKSVLCSPGSPRPPVAHPRVVITPDVNTTSRAFLCR